MSGCGPFSDEVVTATGPRQQLIDVAIRVTIDDPGEDVSQVGERIDAVQLTGFDQGCDNGPVLGPAGGACEQSIFQVERDRTDRTLGPSLNWRHLPLMSP